MCECEAGEVGEVGEAVSKQREAGSKRRRRMIGRIFDKNKMGFIIKFQFKLVA